MTVKAELDLKKKKKKDYFSFGFSLKILFLHTNTHLTYVDVTKRLLYLFGSCWSAKSEMSFTVYPVWWTVSYCSPDASFHSSWNDRLLFHFTVHFKLPVKAFGTPAEYLFQVFWFPDKVQSVMSFYSTCLSCFFTVSWSIPYKLLI